MTEKDFEKTNEHIIEGISKDSFKEGLQKILSQSWLLIRDLDSEFDQSLDDDIEKAYKSLFDKELNKFFMQSWVLIQILNELRQHQLAKKIN